MAAPGLLTGGLGLGLPTPAIIRLGFFTPATPTPGRLTIPSSSFGASSMEKFIQALSAILVWAGLVKASTPWAGAECHLFTNDITPTDTTVEADLTPAAFTGYAPIAITWGTPYLDATGQVIFEGNNCTFLCTGGVGEILYGYYIIGAGGEYLGGARFSDAPRTVTGAGTGTSVVPVAAF